MYAKIMLTIMLLHFVVLSWHIALPKEKEIKNFDRYFISSFVTTCFLFFLDLIWS